MTQEKTYFLISYAAVPVCPTFQLWSSTWTTERPVLDTSAGDPLLVGYTTEETLPDGAIYIMSSDKDPPPPPPPPPGRTEEEIEAYKGSFLLALGRGGLRL